MNEGMTLYSYWRSSAAWRVRIALALKALPHDIQPVHLLKDGGQQHQAGYRRLNPQARVPTLLDGERVLTQSLAIIEYLDECYPEPPLLPATPRERARVRAMAQLVACDIHPVNNLRVLQRLEQQFGADGEAKTQWMHHWMADGFDALEQMLADNPATGDFCEGDHPSLADLCLVPQLYNARRFQLDLGPWPEIRRIESNCLALPAFSDTAPEQQPDAE